ncbi:MAG TPA: hypothetical protein DDW53_20325 [Lachnoclostridium sp.]|nr:hypothetical protein [Lachnoclostridium sp.]
MKRVSVNIDLKENEAFDKEVQEIIRAKVKETVRNEYSTMMQDAASQEFKRLFDANTCGYRTKLEDTVKNCAIRGIKEVLEEMDVPKLIQEKAEELMEAKIAYYLHDIDYKCKVALDTIVTKQAAEQIKKILG